MLVGSIQVCYDESIVLEEMYSVEMQLSSCKPSGNCSQEPKVSILCIVVVLQFWRWSTMSNDVHESAKTQLKTKTSYNRVQQTKNS